MGSNHEGPYNARLLELSNDATRIATELARLSIDGCFAVPVPTHGTTPQFSSATVQSHIRARRLRERYFEQSLFAEPAWDMMLDLLHAELNCRRISVSSLCVATNVSQTTALRWLNLLVERQIFVRRSDPFDGRRVFIELSADASASLKRYFDDLAMPVAIQSKPQSAES